VKKWNLIIDVEKCEDCNNCFLACKDEHVDNDWQGYSLSQPLHGHRWINIMRKERGQYPLIDVAYLPTPCMHCDSAPCVKASKNGAAYKREDGIVIIDPEKSKGQKNIIEACPYNAIWWNEEMDVPQKCTFCAHLLDDGWDKPRCVQACPTGALRAVLEEDTAMKRAVKEERLEVLVPERNTQPRVYYKNLYRFTRCFIGGSVAHKEDGKIDCSEGAAVKLFKDSKKVDEVMTDNFGDFKFDNLGENSGKYTVEIHCKDYKKKSIDVELKESINIGDILFENE
jgi:Fe-S-cluster-containing dehydrogenase component